MTDIPRIPTIWKCSQIILLKIIRLIEFTRVTGHHPKLLNLLVVQSKFNQYSWCLRSKKCNINVICIAYSYVPFVRCSSLILYLFSLSILCSSWKLVTNYMYSKCLFQAIYYDYHILIFLWLISFTDLLSRLRLLQILVCPISLSFQKLYTFSNSKCKFSVVVATVTDSLASEKNHNEKSHEKNRSQKKGGRKCFGCLIL